MQLPTAAIAFLAALLATPAWAQTDDARPRVEQPGIAFVQDFPTSQPRLRRFDAYTDQTATGYTGRGFYLFRFEKSSKDTRVPASQVKMILVEPTLPDTILTESDRSNLATVVARFEKASLAFPNSASSIMELANSFSEAIESYDDGNVRVDREWVNKIDHMDRQIARYDTQLRAEMDSAQSKRDFNYKRNPFYLEIKKLAPTDPYIEERLKKIESDFSAILAREDLEAMLVELNNPDLPKQKTTEIIEKLAEVNDPTAVVTRILVQSKTAAELAESCQATRRALNAAFAAIVSPLILPDLTPELVTQTQSLMAEIRKFLAGQPPAAIRVPATEARDMLTIAEGVPTLKGMLDSRNLAAATELASKLAGNADSIGGPAKATFSNIKVHCATELERCATLRAEADELAKAGKKKEASAKLAEVLEITTDPEVEKQLAELQAP